MKLFPRLVSSLLVLLLASQLMAEGETTATAAAPPDETPDQAVTRRKDRRKVLNESLKDQQALPTEDPNLEVRNINYLKNYASSGRGEFLNVTFDLINKSEKTKEYLVYVLALHEAVVPVPYPSNWRADDPQKNIKIIKFQKLSPELLEDKTVIGEKTTTDMANLKYKSILNESLNRLDEPTLDNFINYLIKNPDKALKVKVFGNESPTKAEYITSNLSTLKEERDRDVNYATENHTWTIQNNKFKTTVTTHHFSLYRNDYLFFNKILVLVFDPSRPNQKLVYRSLQTLNGLNFK
ncbi:MAG: hypothetical protein EBS19_01675 [Spirochaetia bacterium]|nr:hypothetical protein [Spirochaetia bacterium]